MLLVILSAPGCLLSGYLALLCYRRNFYPQALCLAGTAVALLLLTIVLLGAGYFTATRFEEYSQNPSSAAHLRAGAGPSQTTH